jgi:hypothetical protein
MTSPANAAPEIPSPASQLRTLLASPIFFLMALAFINWLGFAAWSAMLNNFAKEAAGFTGREIGLLQSVREIPGLLAFTAIAFFLVMREQSLAYISLAVLAVGVAMTGFYPHLTGLLATTLIMSIGFHYYETAQQGLALQLLPRKDAPRGLGRIAGAAAAAQFLAYGSIAIAFVWFKPTYQLSFLVAGSGCLILTIIAALLFKRFQGETPQRKGIVLKKRYWLYYALTFMSGARRQIFTAFAGFLLVERFGYDVATIASLFLVTCAINTFAAPRLGSLVGKLGERTTILMENTVLVLVFIGYAFVSDPKIAGALYILDGVFLTLTLAQRTYFQKIASPEDISPTAAVAFTINHILAVGIPVTFGLIWLWSPAIVFFIGAGIATGSLVLACLVPRHPDKHAETIFSKPAVQAA